MQNFDASQLSLFIGTTNYYCIARSVVITDGAKYVAENAGAFWLMDAIASYLPQFTGREEFVVARLNVKHTSADLTLDNGNNKVLDRQHIGYTDFPLASFMLYACWSGEYWVVMLPSEY